MKRFQITFDGMLEGRDGLVIAERQTKASIVKEYKRLWRGIAKKNGYTVHVRDNHKGCDLVCENFEGR